MISVTEWGGRCVQERFQRTDSGGSLQQNHLTQSHAGQLLFLSSVSPHCGLNVVAWAIPRECYYSRSFHFWSFNHKIYIYEKTVYMMMWDVKQLAHLCVVWWKKSWSQQEHWEDWVNLLSVKYFNCIFHCPYFRVFQGKFTSKCNFSLNES